MKRFLVVGAVLALGGCGEGFDYEVGPEDVVGEEWPLTIPSFTVDCTTGMDVFAVYEGVGYPLRGGVGQQGRANFKSGTIGETLKVRKLDPKLQALSPGVRLPMDKTRRVALQRCVDAGVASFELPNP